MRSYGWHQIDTAHMREPDSEAWRPDAAGAAPESPARSPLRCAEARSQRGGYSLDDDLSACSSQHAAAGREAGCGSSTPRRAAATGAAGWVGRSWDHAGATRTDAAPVASGVVSSRIAVAAVGVAAGAVLGRLADDANAAVRSTAAASPQAGRRIVTGLVHDTSPGVLAAVAASTLCPVPTLRRLIRHDDETVRRSAALNQRLAQRHVPQMHLADRVWAAGRQRCPPGTLQALAQDAEALVRTSAATHPRCPPGTLEALAQDAHGTVRAAVAGNSASTVESLRHLSGDVHYWVRSETASHPKLPVDALQRLMRDDYWLVRAGVANNEQCTPRMLHHLSDDPIINVRLAIAMLAECPTEVLAKLEPSRKRCFYVCQVLILGCWRRR